MPYYSVLNNALKYRIYLEDKVQNKNCASFLLIWSIIIGKISHDKNLISVKENVHI